MHLYKSILYATKTKFLAFRTELMDVDQILQFALILTRSRLVLFHVNFRKFITELWPLTDVRNSTKVAYALILTRSRLILLHALWPLIDVRISFPLDILSIN